MLNKSQNSHQKNKNIPKSNNIPAQFSQNSHRIMAKSSKQNQKSLTKVSHTFSQNLHKNIAKFAKTKYDKISTE